MCIISRCILRGLFGATVFILTIDMVRGQRAFSRDNSESDVENRVVVDEYTFVALIDIVFTDGSKRTCTGAIIHDNVVITLAHCFILAENESVECELTASFVVIGTKKMFDSGYEQYLPIERVITHPRHKGWEADLALVYTFAGMMSDKPGRILLLAGEKSFSQIDSNVTVLSWGRCGNDDIRYPSQSQVKVTQMDGFDQSIRRGRKRVTQPVWRGWQSQETSRASGTRREERRRMTTATRPRDTPNTDNSQEEQYYQLTDDLSDNIIYKKKRRNQVTYQYKFSNAYSSKHVTKDNAKRKKLKPYGTMPESVRRETERTNNSKSSYDSLSYYRSNWRRKMGSLDNKLTVEVFNLLHSSPCKKIIKRAFPHDEGVDNTYNSNEFICYSSDEHYITKEDDGAPAVRHGQLVGITTVAVECNGDHIAIGIKTACFCSWIEENLPGNKKNMKCCKNCCEKDTQPKDKKPKDKKPIPDGSHKSREEHSDYDKENHHTHERL